MNRDIKTVVSDVHLFKAAKEIREYLCTLCPDMIPRLNEDPNPFYSRSIDGLFLQASYGLPSLVGTPIGGWILSGGGCVTSSWLEIAKERLGLVEIQAQVNDKQGSYGPVWAITKDLQGEPLVQTECNILGYGMGLLSESVLTASGLVPKSALITASVYVKGLAAAVAHLNLVLEDTADEDITDYKIMRRLWDKIKPQIGFVAWCDRVDPDYELVPLYLPEHQVAAIDQMKGDVTTLKGKPRVYQLRDNQGLASLTLVVTYKKGYVCTYAVGEGGRKPTEEECQLLTKLFVPREVTLAFEESIQ